MDVELGLGHTKMAVRRAGLIPNTRDFNGKSEILTHQV